MVTKIVEIKKTKLKNGMLVVGLPGIGNVGRIAAGYLVNFFKTEKIAELYSDHFGNFIWIDPQTSLSQVIKNEFFKVKGARKLKRDMVILIGDMQSMDPQGHYEIAETILAYAKKIGIKEVVTLAGYSIGEKVNKPHVLAVANSEKIRKKYEKLGIDFNASEKIGSIIGAAGLLIGLAKFYKMNGICLLGETHGSPILPDPKASEAVLKTFSKIINFEIDTSDLHKQVVEAEELYKRVKDMEKQAIMRLLRQEMPKEEKEKLTYIG